MGSQSAESNLLAKSKRVGYFLGAGREAIANTRGNACAASRRQPAVSTLSAFPRTAHHLRPVAVAVRGAVAAPAAAVAAFPLALVLAAALAAAAPLRRRLAYLAR